MTTSLRLNPLNENKAIQSPTKPYEARSRTIQRQTSRLVKVIMMMPLNPVGKIYYAVDYNEASAVEVCFDLLVGIQFPLGNVSLPSSKGFSCDHFHGRQDFWLSVIKKKIIFATKHKKNKQNRDRVGQESEVRGQVSEVSLKEGTSVVKDMMECKLLKRHFELLFER